MIQVNFFAALKEQLECEQIELEFEGIASVTDVKNKLVANNPNWKTALDNQSLLMAVNHEMVSQEYAVKDNDEVAFFPPVTGG